MPKLYSSRQIINVLTRQGFKEISQPVGWAKPIIIARGLPVGFTHPTSTSSLP